MGRVYYKIHHPLAGIKRTEPTAGRVRLRDILYIDSWMPAAKNAEIHINKNDQLTSLHYCHKMDLVLALFTISGMAMSLPQIFSALGGQTFGKFYWEHRAPYEWIALPSFLSPRQ